MRPLKSRRRAIELRAGSTLLLCVVSACGAAQYQTNDGHASVVAPVSFAEGNTGKPPVAPKSDPVTATTDDAKRTPPQKNKNQAQQTGAVAGPSDAESPIIALPDPAPLTTRHHYELDVQYDKGTIHVVAVRAVTTGKPVTTQRTMGRFAFELWIGPELIDRVRFDFPLLGAEEPHGDVIPLHAPVSLAAAAQVSRTLRVPASERATSARIIDRATGEETEVDWPPVVAGDTTPAAEPPAAQPPAAQPMPSSSAAEAPQPAAL